VREPARSGERKKNCYFTSGKVKTELEKRGEGKGGHWSHRRKNLNSVANPRGGGLKGVRYLFGTKVAHAGETRWGEPQRN